MDKSLNTIQTLMSTEYTIMKAKSHISDSILIKQMDLNELSQTISQSFFIEYERMLWLGGTSILYFEVNDEKRMVFQRT